ncbi:MAG: hypothetical protein GY756_14130 [bacterium]|nr:hypothetical protein [bacterium]
MCDYDKNRCIDDLKEENRKLREENKKYEEAIKSIERTIGVHCRVHH